MPKNDIIIKDTHRGLLYEDGVQTKILEAGKYEPPRLKFYERLVPKPWRRRLPKIEIALVDMRERDLTIKGQEILTADKVAIRVSIIVQFKVTNPRAALHEVESYSDRIYGDVQLAARRSLASMTLEEILTNRNQLSEDILQEVKESATTFGVAILRADVKDLIFPGNLQEIMNRVLAAERMSQVQLVEARTKAETQRLEAQSRFETQRLEAQSRFETQRLEAEANAATQKLRAESEAESQRIQTEADILALRERAQAAQAYSAHPALLRLRELDTLRDLARTANARIYIGFDKHMQSSNANGDKEE